MGDIATFSKGQGYSKSDLISSGFPIILYGQLYTNYQTSISDVTTFVNNDEDAIKSIGNEVIVPASGETAEDIARATAIEKQGIIIGGDLNIVRPNKKVRPFFLALTLSNGNPKNSIAKKAQGKSVVHIRNDDLKEIQIIFPNTEEQTAIGNFFKQLDETIALHQRQTEKYQKLKIGFLESVFCTNLSQNNSKKTNAWEQRKLKEISEKIIEKNVNNNISETFTNSAEFGVISQRDFFDKDIANVNNLNGYYIVKNDDFIYNPRISNFAPVGPIKRNKLGKTGVMSPLYYVFRTHGVDRQFLETYFETTRWHEFMKLNGDTGARSDRFSIKDSVFCEMPIFFPCFEEQTAIGNFFKQLDETIALHQRQLEKYRLIKKLFLEKMFIK